MQFDTDSEQSRAYSQTDMQGNLSGPSPPIFAARSYWVAGPRPGTRLRPFFAHLIPAAGSATIAACSISENRKQLATGSFTSQGGSLRYSSSGGCCGCTYCECLIPKTAYSFPKNPVISGSVQSTAPMNFRLITPLRSMMNVSGHPCVPYRSGTFCFGSRTVKRSTPCCFRNSL